MRNRIISSVLIYILFSAVVFINFLMLSIWTTSRATSYRIPISQYVRFAKYLKLHVRPNVKLYHYFSSSSVEFLMCFFFLHCLHWMSLWRWRIKHIEIIHKDYIFSCTLNNDVDFRSDGMIIVMVTFLCNLNGNLIFSHKTSSDLEFKVNDCTEANKWRRGPKWFIQTACCGTEFNCLKVFCENIWGAKLIAQHARHTICRRLVRVQTWQ